MDLIPEKLIVRFLSRDATPEETESLLEWVAKDEKNHCILIERMEAWQGHDSYPLVFDLSRGLRILNEKVEAIDERPKKGFPWLRAAAAILLLVTLSWIGTYIWTGSGGYDQELVAYEASSGKLAALLLADGTRVTLNQGATLWCPEVFTGNLREVKLTGEAYFDVARNPDKPFVIVTGTVQTQVLGTSFNVNAGDNEVEVTVAEGSVRVTYEDQSEVLTPFQKATCDLSNMTLSVHQTDLASELAWKYPVLKFSDDTLESVVASLQAHYRTQIAFDQESQKRCLFSGSFSRQPLTKILNAICFTTGLRLVTQDQSYRLIGKGCE